MTAAVAVAEKPGRRRTRDRAHDHAGRLVERPGAQADLPAPWCISSCVTWHGTSSPRRGQTVGQVVDLATLLKSKADRVVVTPGGERRSHRRRTSPSMLELNEHGVYEIRNASMPSAAVPTGSPSISTRPNRICRRSTRSELVAAVTGPRHADGRRQHHGRRDHAGRSGEASEPVVVPVDGRAGAVGRGIDCRESTVAERTVHVVTNCGSPVPG